MKILIIIAILFGGYSTSSASGNFEEVKKRVFEDSTSLGLVMQKLLEYPVDSKKLDSLNIHTSHVELAPLGFGAERVFVLNNQELGECIGRRIVHKDSTWSFGMSNWQFESFVTSSPQLPLLFGLTVGNSINEISNLFGEPSSSGENELVYDYVEQSGIILKIVLKDDLITKIEIKKNNR